MNYWKAMLWSHGLYIGGASPQTIGNAGHTHGLIKDMGRRSKDTDIHKQASKEEGNWWGEAQDGGKRGEREQGRKRRKIELNWECPKGKLIKSRKGRRGNSSVLGNVLMEIWVHSKVGLLTVEDSLFLFLSTGPSAHLGSSSQQLREFG